MVTKIWGAALCRRRREGLGGVCGSGSAVGAGEAENGRGRCIQGREGHAVSGGCCWGWGAGEKMGGGVAVEGLREEWEEEAEAIKGDRKAMR
jgi:hypothetical protein